MFKKIKGMFKKEKEIQVTEIPIGLMAKYTKHLVLAGIILIAGLLVCVLMFNGLEILKAFLMPLAISAILCFEGIFFKRKIMYEGFETLEGICVDYKYSNVGTKLIDGDFSVRKQVIGLIVETEDKIIMVPVSKLNDIPAVGGKLLVYVPKNTFERKNANGITVFATVYGYELIPDYDNTENEKISENPLEITEG